MKHYQLTSIGFEGAVDLYFNDNGMLETFDLSNATLSIKQHEWVLKQMPKHLEEISLLLGNSDTAKLTEVKQTISFELFWEKYDDKISSSRKRAKQKWDKMSLSDRERAFYYISKYFSSLGPGIRKKYAETFLNAELWNN